ncbi:MAG TPA: TonB C-terminal domain-containing protein [Candidatus Saccharimonadales bacterium]|nr:TonB C-terminal domain-containing protein [Candidatus Saccharimonadales bacterium]
MQEHKEEYKKNSSRPIIVWIIASILLHIILALISMVLHINDHHKENTFKKNDRFFVSPQEKKSATMMLDQIKPTTAKKALEKKTEKPIEKQVKPDEPPLIHTLIPGRKGLDLQNITDELSKAQGQQPQKITSTKPTQEKKISSAQEAKQASAPKPVPVVKPVVEKKELIKKLRKIASNMYDSSQLPQIEQTQQDIPEQNEQALHESKPVQEISNTTHETSSHDPYEYVPKQTMSLKDLQLGFNQFLSNVGNTECLIQQGNTKAVPDGQSLKHITYNNQFAKTMLGSIHMHPKARVISYGRNKQISFIITIDRKGNLLDLRITKESGDPLIDTVTLESLRNAGLYPAVPSFISDDPYVQQWTILY